ncbi:hypothetical protein QYF36_021061 [Acer negundo]|nr:hypothetical protein QYF36_021061 [Acer negundo]
MASSRWIRPEVYSLFVAIGVTVGICEGEKYKEHPMRKYVCNKAPQIMPSINDFFTKPDLPNRSLLLVSVWIGRK